ncbi:MAG: hypothetical protein ACREFQ_04415, partial [Stellaceae bacterium]
MLVAWLLCGVGWATVMMLPLIFQAKTRIYVDTDSLVRPLMKGIAVDSNVLNFVDLMQRTLLSRPNLQKVIRMADLDIGGNTDNETLLRELHSRISITNDSGNLFTITYTGPNRDTATKVIRALLNVFVDTNLGNSRQDMQVARDFIDEQLKGYAAQLDQAEKRMADFRSKNSGYLPGADNYTAKLDAAKSKLQSSQAELDDATHQRDALQAQLAAIPQFLEGVDSGYGAGPPIGDGAGSMGPAAPIGPDPQLRVIDLQQKLDELSLIDTPEHPDVIQLKRQLEDAKKQAAVAKAKEEKEAKADKAPAPAALPT